MNKQIPVAVILCGGMATRLGKLSENTPKALMTINGKTVIDIIINRLKSQQIKKIVLCAGHLHNQLLDKFKYSSDIKISIENHPLGTGGAIKNALEHIDGDLFFVMNGDTLSNINYVNMWNHHLKNRKSATIAITKKTKRYDSNVLIVEGDLVKKFYKKIGFNEITEDLYENAGTYLFSKIGIPFDSYPEKFSLEDTTLPNLAIRKELNYWLLDEPVIDIGTVDRLNYANNHWRG